jgi:hypothetical protein
MENFENHLTFYHSKNTTLNAVRVGFDDSFLAWLPLNSFNSNDNPSWSVASINIVTSDITINQWAFNHIAGKLRETLRNNIPPTERELSSTGQTALNAATSKTNQNRYNGPPCAHPNCRRPKSHATEDCWTKQKEERDKANRKKHKAKKAKRRPAKTDSESGANSGSESDSEPKTKRRHHAHRSHAESNKTLRVLKAVSHHSRSCAKPTKSNIFIAHPDSGASNHMTHKKELFDPGSFETLMKPIPISPGTTPSSSRLEREHFASCSTSMESKRKVNSTTSYSYQSLKSRTYPLDNQHGSRTARSYSMTTCANTSIRTLTK